MEKTAEKQQLEILKHKLVPSHIIISENEKKDLLERLKITPDQLPKILNTDPTSISIGAKPGQIIKIIRKSPTAGEAVAYRYVVESTEWWV